MGQEMVLRGSSKYLLLIKGGGGGGREKGACQGDQL